MKIQSLDLGGRDLGTWLGFATNVYAWRKVQPILPQMVLKKGALSVISVRNNKSSWTKIQVEEWISWNTSLNTEILIFGWDHSIQNPFSEKRSWSNGSAINGTFQMDSNGWRKWCTGLSTAMRKVTRNSPSLSLSLWFFQFRSSFMMALPASRSPTLISFTNLGFQWIFTTQKFVMYGI